MNSVCVTYRSARYSYLLVLLLLYAIAASQAIWSFSYKWTNFVDHPQYSLQRLTEGSAPKPYAYRVLVPFVIREITARLPESVKEIMLRRGQMTLERTAPGRSDSYSSGMTVAYTVSIILDFIALLATLVMLRAFARRLLPDDPALADYGPIAFALLLTLTFRTDGGFPYDFMELMLLLGYMLLVLRRSTLSAVVIVVAVLNKESAILFPLLVLPFFIDRGLSSDRSLSLLVFDAVSAFLAFLTVRWVLRDVSGGVAEVHWAGNVSFWLSVYPWISATTPHLPVIPMPKPSNVAILVPILIFLGVNWGFKPLYMKLMVAFSTIISFPLFLILCYRDEFRNLSLMYPALYIASIHSMATFYSERASAVGPKS